MAIRFLLLVVGMVSDVRDAGLDRPASATVYFPVFVQAFHGRDQIVKRSVTFTVRSTRAGTDALLQDIRQAVWSVQRNVPLSNARTLAESTQESMARTSFTLVMLALAGTMALALGHAAAHVSSHWPRFALSRSVRTQGCGPVHMCRCRSGRLRRRVDLNGCLPRRLSANICLSHEKALALEPRWAEHDSRTPACDTTRVCEGEV